MPDFPFQPMDLQRLRRLVFAARIPTAPGTTGSHRIRRGGEGWEFLDFRHYTPGDDFRRIDWSLFGRLRELVVRVMQAEESVYVTSLVDVSASMDFGSPLRKVQLACQLAAGVSHLMLGLGDRVSVGCFAERLATVLGPVHGLGQVSQVVAHLREAAAGGVTDLSLAVSQYLRQGRHRGLVILISDFLGPGDPELAIDAILRAGNRVLVVQVMDGLDFAEGLDGAFAMEDSESGRRLDVTVDGSVRRAVRHRVEAYCQRLAGYCRRRQQGYLLARTAETFLEILCQAHRDKVLSP